MSKLLSLLLLFIVYAVGGWAQVDTSLDALLQKENDTSEDAVQVKLLRDIGFAYSRTSTEKAGVYYQKAIRLGTRIGELRYTGSTYTQLAILMANLSKEDSATYYLKKSMAIARILGVPKDLAGYYQGEGLVRKKFGNNVLALESFNKELGYLNASPDEVVPKAGTFMNLAGCYMNMGRFQRAVEMYLQALSLFESAGNQRGIAYCHNNIGTIYVELKQNGRAIYHLNKSLALKQRLSDSRGLMSTHLMLGRVLTSQGQYKEALLELHKGLELAKSLASRVNIYKSYWLNARAFKRLNDTPAVRQNYTKALSYATTDADRTLLRQELQAYLGKNRNAALADPTGIAKSALLVGLKEKLQVAKNTQDSMAMFTIYKQLAIHSAGTGAFETAYQYLIRYEDLQSNMYGPSVSLKVRQIENDFEIKKREQQILLLRKTKELNESRLQKQHLWLSSTAVFILFSIIITGLLINRYRILQRTKRLQEMEKMRRNIARDLHDEIGSTLSSIQIMSNIALRGPQQADPASQATLAKIARMSSHISENMREIVWAINPCNDNLGQTITHMRELAAQLLENDGIELSFKTVIQTPQKVLMPAIRKNLLMIFKEALNNARKYSSCKNIEVVLTQTGEQLQLQIEDYGIGFDMDQAVFGNGLHNMQERAKSVAGSIDISSALNQGTLIRLCVPLP
ncbi:MAG TPA: sensor histidine kinase [Arachidicoccus sp.]|nr:sensor histidine kinase [Arachidicoccus sp.]